MKTINILVVDSNHSKEIALLLQKFYGRRVQCFISPPEHKKIDIFFVSGNEVLHQEISLSQLKEEFGKDNSKTVAMSVMKQFLKEIENRSSLQVDFVLYKLDFFKALSWTNNSKEVSVCEN